MHGGYEKGWKWMFGIWWNCVNELQIWVNPGNKAQNRNILNAEVHIVYYTSEEWKLLYSAINLKSLTKHNWRHKSSLHPTHYPYTQ